MWSLKKGLYLLLFLISLGHSQDYEKISKLYNERQFEKVIENASLISQQGKATPHILSILGRAYVDIGRYLEAIPHLNCVLNQRENIPAWMYGWSLYYLSKAFAGIGELDSARIYLEKTIDTKATKSVVMTAKMDLINLGISPIFNVWEVKETKNIKFYFQTNSKVKNTDMFAQERQDAFDTINSFFNAVLPKKIKFYVWNNSIEYEKRNKRPSGFAIPEVSIIHSRYFQTLGHEITHIISYNAFESSVQSAFINEGIAVYFDLSNRDRINLAIKARKEVHIPIINMWKSDSVFRNIKQEYSYAIAGAFIKYLIDKQGKEKFLKFLSNQTYDNALIIYGQTIDELMKEFEKLIKA